MFAAVGSQVSISPDPLPECAIVIVPPVIFVVPTFAVHTALAVAIVPPSTEVILITLPASGTATVGTVGSTSGEFFGADGKISEDVMRVQDLSLIHI